VPDTPDVPDVVAALQAASTRLRAENAGLKAENAELKAQLAEQAEKIERCRRDSHQSGNPADRHALVLEIATDLTS
jgi:regulator of replication initiation timing